MTIDPASRRFSHWFLELPVTFSQSVRESVSQSGSRFGTLLRGRLRCFRIVIDRCEIFLFLLLDTQAILEAESASRRASLT